MLLHTFLFENLTLEILCLWWNGAPFKWVQSLGIVPKNMPKGVILRTRPSLKHSPNIQSRFLLTSFKPEGENCCVITEQFLYFGDEVPMTYVTAAAAVLSSTLLELNN